MRFRIFDSYFLDINPNSHRLAIVSVKRRVEKILKPTVRSGMSYYRLYQHGVSKEFSLEDLVSKIESFMNTTQISHKTDNFTNEAG